MQITIPDEFIQAGKIILMTLGAALILVIVGVGIWHMVVPAQPTGQTVIAPTPTPAPTPPPYPEFWTNYQKIVFLGTSAGFPQANFPDGRGFNLPWGLYDRLYLQDYVSFHVTGEYQPYGTTIYFVDDVRWGYGYWDDYRTRIVYGSAGRFCINEWEKYSC